ncbi:hypothetical protein CTAYLR_006321 [Chrysophaeum taylorii]|uniref:Bardet-Biedl syndrome 1 N-terminal domain-containing protein n=1 Tax=Chrysophaeum taylorii TaxID=2483200 RepID=A0AAD7XJT1_9STRA|nr:hypothetical protein CTAYLR_006321 [Chrysophaeum taylorii]
MAPWLHAHYDKLAGIRAHAGGIALAEVEGGEGALVVADYARKLRVFKGTRQTAEIPLPPSSEIPSGVCGFYMDDKKIPAIGVASGPHLYVFRCLRPYHKYTAPPVEADALEAKVWRSEEMSPADIRTALAAAHAEGAKLGPRSLAMLPLTSESKQRAHVERVSKIPTTVETTITCTTTLPKASEEPHAMSCVVLGTESRKVIVLEPSAKAALCEVEVPAPPAILRAAGCFDVDWRVYVACRDARVYTITIGDHRGTAVIRKPHLELEAQPAGLVVKDKHLYVATADSRVACYLLKGRRHKVFSLAMPAPVTNMELLVVRKARQVTVLLVALANGEVRVYRDKDLVDVLRVNEVVAAMTSGTYGREDNTLILVTQNGSLLVKMLPRTATFEVGSTTAKGGPPPEQDVPLDIPKRTRLYLDQIDREKANAPAIFRTFQKDALKLKIATATAYLQLRDDDTANPDDNTANDDDDDNNNNNNTAAAALTLAAKVNGLGPFFHIVLEVRLNAGLTSPLRDLPVVLSYDPDLYRTSRPAATLPLLIPGIAAHAIFEIECIDESKPAHPIAISVLGHEEEEEEEGSDDDDDDDDDGDDDGDKPLVSSTLIMPQSETLD